MAQHVASRPQARCMYGMSLLNLGAAVALIVAAVAVESNDETCTADSSIEGCSAPVGRENQEEESPEEEMHTINVKLVEWMRKEGAVIHRCLEARGCPPFGGRCMGTTCDLEAGETLLSVPPHLQLAPYDSIDVSPCPALAEGLAEEGAKWNVKEDEMLLLLRLLEASSFSSEDGTRFFEPYLKSLPKEYPSILSDEQDQMRCLNGLPGSNAVDRRFIRERVKIGLLQRCASAGDENRTLWAKLTLNTRAFSGTVPNATKAKGEKTPEWSRLVPLADIFNDHPVPTAKWGLNSATGFFEVNTTAAVAAGSEVLVSYGAKSNEQIMTKYGFIHPENTFDKATIYLKDGSALAGPPPSLSLSLGLTTDLQLQGTLKRPLGKLRDEVPSEFRNDLVKAETTMLTELRQRCTDASVTWAKSRQPVRQDSAWLCDGYRQGIIGLASACSSFADMATAELETGDVSVPSSTAVDRLAARLLDAWREIYAAL